MGKGVERGWTFLWVFVMNPGAQPISGPPSCPGPCPAGLPLVPPRIVSFPFRSKTRHDYVWKRVGRKHFTDFLGRWGQEAP